MNIKEIKELIAIVDKSNLTGFEYENSGVKIVLKKETNIVVGSMPVSAAPAVQAAPAATPTAAPAAAAVVEDGTTEVVSPIVGTFYEAPSPDAKPFAAVGDKVKKGQPLCIVEAMKLMNEITAEYDCEVVKILVKNEEVVQYGQPLFAVKAL